MTELLYLKDSYLQDFEATVVSIEGRNVILDKTAFYPEGGGLPDDRGKIVKLPDGENFQVMMVKKFGQQILHEVDINGLKVGDKVHGWIDWKRRYKMMKMHTATHVLAAVIHNEIGALITGNKLMLDSAHIDFNGPEVKDRYKEFEQKVNDILARNLSVETKFMPYREAMKIPSVVKLANVLPPSIPELRIVSIGDACRSDASAAHQKTEFSDCVDVQADGGPHVKNTSECGKIEITSFENKGKDRKRIYFVLT